MNPLGARSLAGILLGVLFSGCTLLAPRPDASRFFVLAPVSEASATKTGLTVGLGPIDLPDYLERTQLVTRVGPNRIHFSESNRWAEPLDMNFKRVLSENVAALLGTDRIKTYPWFGATELDYQVEIEVLRFESDAAGKVELAARWVVRDGSGKSILRTGESSLQEPAASPATDDAVAALSRALGELSREIAQAVLAERSKRAH